MKLNSQGKMGIYRQHMSDACKNCSLLHDFVFDSVNLNGVDLLCDVFGYAYGKNQKK